MARAGDRTRRAWSSSADPNWDRVRDVDLAEQGLTEAQVQVIWVKEADIMPSSSLPAADADAYELETFLGDIIRAARTRYPNLKCVFLSSRIYAGYTTEMLNPEPYAYESGFAVKWIVQAQIDQMANGGVIVDPHAGDLNYDTGAPWIGWGPYLWADGLIPRGSDGLRLGRGRLPGRLHAPLPVGRDEGRRDVARLLQERSAHTPLVSGAGRRPDRARLGPGRRDGRVRHGRRLSARRDAVGGGDPASGISVTPGEITATTPSLAAGTLNDVVVANPDSTTGSIEGGFLADFADVAASHPFHDFVESLFRAGITSGCGGGIYCVDSPVTRAEMAVLLLKSRYGPFHAPPPATGVVFGDVQPGDFAAEWIEELNALGITGGCGNGNYCPNDSVTRAQMAVFLVKTKYVPGYTPPPCAGLFADVLCPATPEFPFSDWIEQLYAEQVTGGCATGPLRYCPDAANLRGEIAVFLTKTFLP